MLSEMWLSKNCNSGDQWVITQSWMGNSDLAPAANYMSQSDQDKNHKLKIEKKSKSILQWIRIHYIRKSSEFS